MHSGPKPPTPLVKRTGRPPAEGSTGAVRFCDRHGWIEFHLVRRGADRKEWKCKRCVGEAVTRRKQKLKRILVEEAGGRCVRCGYDRCILNLTFHHLDPSQKRLSMSMETGRSLAAFREEAKKCVLLCANCHREVEAARLAQGLVPKARTPRKPVLQESRPTELRRCRLHGVTEFALYGRQQPRWRCKKCNVAAHTKRRRALRRELVAAAGRCCAVCGYNQCEQALQFHHVDPSTKSFHIGSPALKSRAAYYAEIVKCILVCSNCHGEIEVGLIECPPAGTNFSLDGEARAA